MRTITCLLPLFITVSPLPIAVTPVATSYIYRSDNNDPGHYINLQTPVYQEPKGYYSPIPNERGYFLDYPPFPKINKHAALIEQAYAEEQVEDKKESESGTELDEDHFSAHGERDTTGYNSRKQDAKGNSGHYESCHNSDHKSEADGELSKHHDEEDAHGKHEESGKNFKSGDHGFKKYHSKGEEVTGYHKVFHKDEFKKDHDFYDVANQRSGFKKHGHKRHDTSLKDSGHKKDENLDEGHESKVYGKQGHREKELTDEDEVGHSAEEGKVEHHNKHRHHSSGGEKTSDKAYHTDDGEDEDEDDLYDSDEEYTAE